jgi:hypothetical protein
MRLYCGIDLRATNCWVVILDVRFKVVREVRWLPGIPFRALQRFNRWPCCRSAGRAPVVRHHPFG